MINICAIIHFQVTEVEATCVWKFIHGCCVMGAYVFDVLKDCRREMYVQGECWMDCCLNVRKVMGEEIFFAGVRLFRWSRRGRWKEKGVLFYSWKHLQGEVLVHGCKIEANVCIWTLCQFDLETVYLCRFVLKKMIIHSDKQCFALHNKNLFLNAPFCFMIQTVLCESGD